MAHAPPDDVEFTREFWVFWHAFAFPCHVFNLASSVVNPLFSPFYNLHKEELRVPDR